MKKSKSIGAIICVLALVQCVLSFLIFAEICLVKDYYRSEFQIFFKNMYEGEGARARGTDLFFWDNKDFFFMFFGLSLVLALISLSNLFLVRN